MFERKATSDEVIDEVSFPKQGKGKYSREEAGGEFN
jgi:hypothetical protein